MRCASDDAALDIVQDAMIRLAEKYADRPAAELPLLFQRILSNATMDWFRRQKVRNAVMQNLSDFESADDDGDFDLLEMLQAAEGTLGAESAADAVSRAQILQSDRSRGGRAAGASTGSLPAALLGGIRRGRDGGGDGLLGRQREDALLPGGACVGEGASGQGNRAMNSDQPQPR